MRDIRKLSHTDLESIFKKSVRRELEVFKDDGSFFEYEVVIDESPKFINLCGVMVDYISGDIALGLQPRTDEYICIGNIKEYLAHLLLGTSKFPEELDLKYILQLIKLDICGCGKELFDEINFSLGEKQPITTKSIVLALMSKPEHSNDKRLKFLKELDENHYGNIQEPIILELIKTHNKCDRASSFFLRSINPESDYKVVENQRGKESFSKLLNSFEGNLESLFQFYIRNGFDEVLLSALKSYAYFSTERRKILTSVPNIKKAETRDILSMAECLTSGFYYLGASKEQYLAYNFMDLMRANSWEQNIIYSIERMEFRDTITWKNITKKLNIDKILREQNLSETEFFKGVVSCCNLEQKHIDRGACQGKPTKLCQYSFISFAPQQLYNAGKVFNLSMNNLLQKGLKI